MSMVVTAISASDHQVHSILIVGNFFRTILITFMTSIILK
jgi:hypothetical protein